MDMKQLLAGGGGGGGLLGLYKDVVLITPGVASVTVPDFATRAFMWCLGGGGGGSSPRRIVADALYYTAGGNGGAGGGVAFGLRDVVPGTSISCTVGAGGARGAFADATRWASDGVSGGTGGTSSIAFIMSATGGQGGVGNISVSVAASPALGGAGTGGDFNRTGGQGGIGATRTTGFATPTAAGGGGAAATVMGDGFAGGNGRPGNPWDCGGGGGGTGEPGQDGGIDYNTGSPLSAGGCGGRGYAFDFLYTQSDNSTRAANNPELYETFFDLVSLRATDLPPMPGGGQNVFNFNNASQSMGGSPATVFPRFVVGSNAANLRGPGRGAGGGGGRNAGGSGGPGSAFGGGGGAGSHSAGTSGGAGGMGAGGGGGVLAGDSTAWSSYWSQCNGGTGGDGAIFIRFFYDEG